MMCIHLEKAQLQMAIMRIFYLDEAVVMGETCSTMYLPVGDLWMDEAGSSPAGC